MIKDIAIQKAIEEAIQNRTKIRFQLEHTPEFEFILFHPYALLSNLAEEHFVIGLVERRHPDTLTNNIAKQKLSIITFVEVLDVNFEPKHELWSNLDLGNINILLKA